MHNYINVSKTTKPDGNAILKTFRDNGSVLLCAYETWSCGFRNHRTSICASMEIMYRSMLQRLPFGNKTIIYQLDEAHVADCLWRVQRHTLMAD